MLIVFIFLQSVLVVFMALHDWIHFPPFTDIVALKKRHSFAHRLFSSLMSSVPLLISLALTLKAWGNFSFAAIIIIVTVYMLLAVSTVCVWWIPYIFGSSAEHKESFTEYKKTHTLLPARGDNVVPNTVHIIIHLLIWACLAIALYYLNYYLEFEKSIWVALFLYCMRTGISSIVSRLFL